MKIFLKKTLYLIPVAIIVWMLIYILFLAIIDEWLKLAKLSFFIIFSSIIFGLEIPEVLIWKVKKIIKYNEFN